MGLNPRLRLMPGTDMVVSMDTASQLMADMAMVVTMARGLLMPSPRLRLMPGTDGGLYGYGLPAYGGYGYGGYYGKRSADAEPKAEADAWYGYGGLYGYGLPAYGGYGYGGYYGKRSADAEPKAEADA